MFKIVDENGDVADVSTIALNPGDVIVIKTENGISENKKKDFSEAIDHFFPRNKVLVLDKNQEIGVLQQPIEVAVDRSIIDNEVDKLVHHSSTAFIKDTLDDLYKDRKVLKEKC